MNQSALKQKIKALAAFPESDPEQVERLGQIMAEADTWDLFRINPLRFAETHGFETSSLLDLFVRGAKIGLFDFEWNMICPACGGVVHTLPAIYDIPKNNFYCTLCDVDVPTDLDSQIEVSFSPSRAISDLAINPYASFENYWRYYFSDNFSWSSEIQDYMENEEVKHFTIVEPDDTAQMSFRAESGQFFRVVCIEHHTDLKLQFTADRAEAPQIVDADLLTSGFSPNTLELPAGDVTLNVRSHLPSLAGLARLCVDAPHMERLLEMHPPVMTPYFTGKMLLNHQTFRDLFRVQNLPYDFRLKVSNITILFTDMKGSTELYDSSGDMVAYSLVQKHFELLSASVRTHSGAVIKTMGDAIMASFSNPLDGFMAATEMMEQMEQMNRESGAEAHEVGLKVGLHTGTAIAVNANETLDYFGQTVNIAARVQGLAQAGEIWITQPVYENEGISDIISGRACHLERKIAVLKGVSENTTVYRCA